MGNSWKYAQVLLVPASNLCVCGHYRKDHNRMKGFCYKCNRGGRVKDITEPPPDDVLSELLGEVEKCEKFQKWPVERVRAFWQVANISIRARTDTIQTMLDDYSTPHP